MSAAQLGVCAAAAAWFMFALLGLALPFILGQGWGMLNGIGVLPLIAWSFADMLIGAGMGTRCLLWLDGFGD